MPTLPGVSREYPQSYPAPRKYGLVIGCVDCRLLDDLVRFLNHDNLTNRYYQATFAGAAIGLSGAAPTYYPRCDSHGKPVGEPLDFSKWKRTLLDHLVLVLKLTKGDLTDVYIVEHTDCGAYREFLRENYYDDPLHPRLADEVAAHERYARALADELAAWYAGAEGKEVVAELERNNGGAKLTPPLIRGFLMDLRGGVDLMFGPEHGTEKR